MSEVLKIFFRRSSNHKDFKLKLRQTYQLLFWLSLHRLSSVNPRILDALVWLERWSLNCQIVPIKSAERMKISANIGISSISSGSFFEYFRAAFRQFVRTCLVAVVYCLFYTRMLAEYSYCTPFRFLSLSCFEFATIFYVLFQFQFRFRWAVVVLRCTLVVAWTGVFVTNFFDSVVLSSFSPSLSSKCQKFIK